MAEASACALGMHSTLGALDKNECRGPWCGSVVQSLLFHKKHYTPAGACEWALNHGFVCDKVDTPKNYHRVRQFDPKLCGCFAMNRHVIKSGTIRMIYCSWPHGYEKQYAELMYQVGDAQRAALSASGKERRAAKKLAASGGGK